MQNPDIIIILSWILAGAIPGGFIGFIFAGILIGCKTREIERATWRAARRYFLRRYNLDQ
jgi:hypothetical protein